MPAFTWGGVRRAAQYEFQVAADRGFGSIVSRGAFRTRNRAATLQTSLANGSYFWRVRAIAASDKAGRWPRTRSFEKAWATAPRLLEPSDALAITWPTRPLVLRWTPVPHATKHHVTVTTDPSLANPAIGSPTRPVETQGTVFALPGALAPGTYFYGTGIWRWRVRANFPGSAVRKASVTASGAGARARKRTGKKGVVRMRVRPTRSGTVTIRVKRRGFRQALARVRVAPRGGVR